MTKLPPRNAALDEVLESKASTFTNTKAPQLTEEKLEKLFESARVAIGVDPAVEVRGGDRSIRWLIEKLPKEKGEMDGKVALWGIPVVIDHEIDDHIIEIRNRSGRKTILSLSSLRGL